MNLKFNQFSQLFWYHEKKGSILTPWILGCKPECTRDPDCSQGYVCQNQRCVEKPGFVLVFFIIDIFTLYYIMIHLFKVF